MVTKALKLYVLAAILLMAFVLLGSAPALAGLTELVSVSSSGHVGNDSSVQASISADGRYVAFMSCATNLVSGDTNGKDDIFVRDRLTGATERISLSSAGAQGIDHSYGPSISADGRYVAFYSYATNLVDGDTNGARDVFVHDRITGVTEIASVSSSGECGNGVSELPSISGDGRYVAFYSRATNLVAGDTNGCADIFVHDRLTTVTERVSVSSSGVQGNDRSEGPPATSADGRYVVFDSVATNLVSGDTNSEWDTFVRDTQLGVTELVSVSSSGSLGGGGGSASISADGRFVAFEGGSGLVDHDTNGLIDIFVRDRLTGITELVSVSSSGMQANGRSDSPTISADGRYVVFVSIATNLVSGDTNNSSDVFVHSRRTGVTERVSVSTDGVQGNRASNEPAISSDGRYVVFSSTSTHLVDGVSGRGDVFIRNIDNDPPSVTVNQASLQPDPTGDSPIKFTVVFSEPVSDFATGDITLSGTAGATAATITGSGTTYNVAVSGMAGNGTVVVDTAAGVAHDAAGNPNTASTSTDNEVTYNAPPENVGISPTAGPLPSASFTLTSLYRDASGYSDINRAYLLISDSLGQANATLLMYDRSANRLYLKNDGNTSWGTGYAPGTNVTPQNSQCYFYVKDTTVSGSGNNLAVNWRIALKSPFSTKMLNAYMYVQDMGGLKDGWELMGVYHSVKPQVVSIDPNTDSLPIDTKTALTCVYRDPNGFADLRKCYLLINDTLNQTNAVFAYYDQSSNKAYLKNDANTSWGTGYTLGTNIGLSNGQCVVYVKDTTASRSGSDLTVNWSFKLQPSVAAKNLYSWMYVTDSTGLFDGWKKVGTHFTPTAPTCVSVTPSTGYVQTGTPLVFTTEYADDNGFGDVYICYLQVSVTSSATNGVYLLYDAKQGKVFLRNDANTAWSVGQTPGTNVTLENSQCIVYVKNTTVTPNGLDGLLVDWSVELKSSQIGKKLCERMFVRDNEMLNSGWHVKGYVRGQ